MRIFRERKDIRFAKRYGASLNESIESVKVTYKNLPNCTIAEVTFYNNGIPRTENFTMKKSEAPGKFLFTARPGNLIKDPFEGGKAEFRKWLKDEIEGNFADTVNEEIEFGAGYKNHFKRAK